jgi:protein translocase SecG subunit
MQILDTILPYIQVALSIFLIAAILLQTRGSSVGGAFGGDNSGSTFYTRRGAEKTLFQATIVLGVLFGITAFLTLFINN